MTDAEMQTLGHDIVLLSSSPADPGAGKELLAVPDRSTNKGSAITRSCPAAPELTGCREYPDPTTGPTAIGYKRTLLPTRIVSSWTTRDQDDSTWPG